MTPHSEKPDKAKRRSDMACTRCRSRKLKCENKDSVPPCKRCEGDNVVECIFVPVADDAKAQKAKNSSRDSSEDRRSHHHRKPSPSPTQVMASHPRVKDEPNDYQDVGRPQGNYTTTFPSDDQVGVPFVNNQPYRGDGSFSGLARSQWSSSSQPRNYPSQSTRVAPYGGHYVTPSGPSPPSESYVYSPSPDPPYSHEIYGPNHQPRAMQNQPYYAPPGPVQQSPSSQHTHPYYLANGHYNPQPSGLAGYPDANMGPQDNSNSHNSSL
ncbi:hypothetical protein NP233_g2144 [Leucocoprinus birnbaumii]|uniref:Zn(2)-C6 fungal-type domain-containing protein n=1 Tax=Leucocoprinus birnbaumii TaxID=56174 RepID=A0AAD5YXG0_9AGAR|nr:hypothetical protein NP233_g2144 [Leucocoprinus birnbaumii]